jgi:hypothetical protein
MNAQQMRSGRGTPLRRVARAALLLEVLLSIGALGGGLVLMLGPRGEIMPLPLSALAGSPFDTYFVPGLILFGVLGLGPLIAARVAWLRHRLAPTAAFVVGASLLIWVAVEVAIIGYSNEPPLQAIYGVLGVAIMLVALRWLLDVGLPGVTGVHRRLFNRRGSGALVRIRRSKVRILLASHPYQP